MRNIPESFIEFYSVTESFHWQTHMSVNYKNILQEDSQRTNRKFPVYACKRVSGLDHAPVWNASVYYNDALFTGGEFSNKKDAEQDAARLAYERINGAKPSDRLANLRKLANTPVSNASRVERKDLILPITNTNNTTMAAIANYIPDVVPFSNNVTGISFATGDAIRGMLQLGMSIDDIKSFRSEAENAIVQSNNAEQPANELVVDQLDHSNKDTPYQSSMTKKFIRDIFSSSEANCISSSESQNISPGGLSDNTVNTTDLSDDLLKNTHHIAIIDLENIQPKLASDLPKNLSVHGFVSTFSTVKTDRYADVCTIHSIDNSNSEAVDHFITYTVGKLVDKLLNESPRNTTQPTAFIIVSRDKSSSILVHMLQKEGFCVLHFKTASAFTQYITQLT